MTNSAVAENSIRRLAQTIFLFLVSAVYFVPIYWMVISSIKPAEKVFSESLFFPTHLSLENYYSLFSSVVFFASPYLNWYLSTLIMSSGYVLVAIATCILGGYAFAQFNFRGKGFLFMTILVTQMIPFHLIVIPLFLLTSKLRLLDTYVGGFLPIAVSPFGLFYMRQFMLEISKDLLDAGRIDGLSEYSVFLRIVVPLTKPGIAAMAIFFSMDYLNNLLWPLVAISKEKLLPLAVGIASLINQYKPRYGMVMAASTLATIPFLLLFLLLRKYFEEGMGAMIKYVEK